MDVTNPPAVVQQAEDTEQQLIDRASHAVRGANIEIGRCASLWTTRFANGRGDAAFAELIGSSQQRVNEARRVYETFGELPETGKLSWSFFVYALRSDDPEDAIEVAEQNRMTVDEFRAWLRMLNGENLRQPANPDDDDTPEDVCTAEGCQDDNGGMEPAGLPDGVRLADDQPHVGAVDPHKKPPSTAVNTPSDFEKEPTRTHQPVPDDDDDEPAISPEAILMTLSNRVESLLNSWTERQPPLTLRQKMAAKLHRIAEQMERD